MTIPVERLHVVIGRKRVLLVRARKAAGFTQEELAYRLHVDRSTIVRWESGENEPLPWLWPKLADLLGVTRARLGELFAIETQTGSDATEVGAR
ncbi:MAG: helix-turn-helix transcriptional regulator [Pseudonocardiaceae bacterium]